MKRKKLIIEIPEWAEGARILVLAGMAGECIADYNPVESTQYVKVKENRCIRCGKCCRWEPGHKDRYFDPQGIGTCQHLVKEVGNNDRWLCSIVKERPASCSSDGKHRECSIMHRLDYNAIEEIDE